MRRKAQIVVSMHIIAFHHARGSDGRTDGHVIDNRADSYLSGGKTNSMRHKRPRSTRWGHLPRAAVVTTAVLIVGTAIVAAVLSSSSTSVGTQSRTSDWGSTVTVNTSSSPVGTLNDDYIGLSFESSEIASGQFDNKGNLAQLLKNLGSGVMRFGGTSSDLSFTVSTPRELDGLARLTKASGWSIFYTENIGELNVSTISSDARAVSKALGGSVSAFACGNEPEFLYRDGVRPSNYSVGDYLSDAADCMTAIRAGAPNAKFEGPDTVTEPTWPSAYAEGEAGLISSFGVHFYPLPCGAHGKTPEELAATLLSQATLSREVWWFDWAAADARTADASLWMTEVNTACSGGDPGLSNSYTSALWVIDYLLSGAEHGVSGMNVQGAINSDCQGYTPLCEVGANEYSAQPIYYGMLFTHLLGAGQLLPVTVTGPSGGTIAAFALRSSGNGLRVLIENLGPQRISVEVKANGDAADSTVVSMTAPSLLAISGTTIQGAKVSADGKFDLGKPGRVDCTSQGCPIAISGYSATILTLG